MNTVVVEMAEIKIFLRNVNKVQGGVGSEVEKQ